MFTLGVLGVCLIALTTNSAAQPSESSKSRNRGWATTFETGGTYQPNASLDGGGDFGVSRFSFGTSLGYRLRQQDTFAFSVGYEHHSYDFDGPNALAATAPWSTFHNLSLAIPLRLQLNQDWSMIAVPMIRLTAEETGDFDNAVNGGGIVGFSYEVNPRFKIGPGFGVLTQVEDSTSFFPVLVIDWTIAKRWRLQTGRSFAASQGPGLTISYELNSSWQLVAGGRFERLRFRLSDAGVQPEGIGEDRNASVFLGARYTLAGRGSIGVFAGMNFAGELRLENATGNRVAAADYDTVPIVGANLQLRF